MEVEGEECTQPKHNFSLPPSPSWVDFYLPDNQTVTIFYNCSSHPPIDAKQHLLCSQDYYRIANTSPSYAFYKDEIPDSLDWYRNCSETVVVPVDGNLVSAKGLSYSDAIRQGFYMKWSSTNWCADCELSGGQCWSYLPDNSTGRACKNGTRYDRHRSFQRTCPRLRSGTHVTIKIMSGVFTGIGGLLLLAVLLCYKRNKIWRNKNKSPINVKAFLESYGCLALQSYKYSDIQKMTNSFKDTLGKGGFGQVFKGKLRDGRLVAVKLLNGSKGDGGDFINEVATIGRTNHVNVVTLVGFCIEGTKRALVYEFMPNGSLERFIYTQRDSTTTLPLGWEKLYEIALAIARGLEYLHRGCNIRILHFDIKPHNILLDQDFNPKISDFGLAKLYPTRESVVSIVGARGTMGYIAPELCCRTFGDVSHKSDVYSYGMMMLEMIGGRKNIDATVENMSDVYFPLWIYNHLKPNNEIEDLEEIQSINMLENEKAKTMIIVALWCIQAHPEDRPSMSKVVEMLEGTIQELQIPPNPSIDSRSSPSTSL